MSDHIRKRNTAEKGIKKEAGAGASVPKDNAKSTSGLASMGCKIEMLLLGLPVLLAFQGTST